MLPAVDYLIVPDKGDPYLPKYWKRKVFAPSSLLFYVGFNKKLKNVKKNSMFHHL